MHVYVKSINVSQKMKTGTTHERAVPFLSIFPEELKSASGRDLAPVLTAAALTAAAAWRPPSCPSQVSQQRNCCPYAQWNTIYPFRKGKLCSQTFMLVSIVRFAHLIQDSTLFLVALSSLSTCNKF